jgi:hypothetical protein
MHGENIMTALPQQSGLALRVTSSFRAHLKGG